MLQFILDIITEHFETEDICFVLAFILFLVILLYYNYSINKTQRRKKEEERIHATWKNLPKVEELSKVLNTLTPIVTINDETNQITHFPSPLPSLPDQRTSPKKRRLLYTLRRRRRNQPANAYVESDGDATKNQVWTNIEVTKLLDSFEIFQKSDTIEVTNWEAISKHVGTRSAKQCKNKYITQKTEKELIKLQVAEELKFSKKIIQGKQLEGYIEATRNKLQLNLYNFFGYAGSGVEKLKKNNQTKNKQQRNTEYRT